MARTPDDPTKAQVWIDNTDPLNPKFEFYFPRGSKGEPGGFNLGTALDNAVDTGTGRYNLNDVMTSGIYRMTATNDNLLIRNFPRNYDTGILEVFERVPGQTLIQVWHSININSRITFERSYVNGWQPWQMYSSTRVSQAAGRAFYQWNDVALQEQLIYGDTGWRDMSSLLVNGWTLGTGGALQVRRVGYQVYWRAYNLNGSAATSSVFVMIPAGFGYETYNNRLPTTDGTSVTSVLVNNTTGIGANVAVPIATAFASNFSNWNYPTVQVWPASLPGSASGGIPNI
ncbi:hypothetical protein SEA_WAWA_2 [Arthrobacter phage Wawa]|uniref:Minor tail protein n=1 Tax=Arthrobacter phage Wawa TaxID=2499021 RepID=A0A3S9UL84_9CAUD|nr:hypothetical protein KDJ08_gp02 [Arthrobacter phage Wawa]AZS11109.1 hypothetical protein SEA_WAWA_2 [Arthrobacter phage Wawa]